MSAAPELFCNSGAYIQPHEVILNRLNFWHENNGKKVFYDAAEFEKSLPTFQDLPVVFSVTHPEKIGKIPLIDAINEVNGKQVGTFSDTKINKIGSPDLRGSLTIHDPAVNELIKEGKVYISSAFTGRPGEDHKLTDIVGNHILVYPVDTGIFPNDNAALFLNQQSQKFDNNTSPATGGKKTMTTPTEEKPVVDPTRELLANQAQKLEDQTTLIANQKQVIEAKDKEISEKSELIANQSKEIESFKAQLKAIKDAERAKEKELFLNQFDKGVLEEFKDRLPELDNPDKYLGIILALNQAQAKVPKFEEKKAEGKQFFGNQEKSEEKEDEEAEEAWTASNVRF